MTAPPTDDVGWVLWAGTIGLASDAAAFITGQVLAIDGGTQLA